MGFALVTSLYWTNEHFIYLTFIMMGKDLRLIFGSAPDLNLLLMVLLSLMSKEGKGSYKFLLHQVLFCIPSGGLCRIFFSIWVHVLFILVYGSAPVINIFVSISVLYFFVVEYLFAVSVFPRSFKMGSQKITFLTPSQSKILQTLSALRRPTDNFLPQFESTDPLQFSYDYFPISLPLMDFYFHFPNFFVFCCLSVGQYLYPVHFCLWLSTCVLY